jgi:hypothetical protein
MLQGGDEKRENDSVPLTLGIRIAVLSAYLFRSPAQVRFEASKEVYIRS